LQSFLIKHFCFFFCYYPANLVFFQHIGALTLYIVNDLGYTTAAFGLFSAINTVIIIFVEVPLNNWWMMSLIRNINARSVVCWNWFWRICNRNNDNSACDCNSSFTFGEMIFFPITAAYTSEIAPSNRRGEYMGYYQMTFSFAFSAGPWLGTVVYEIMVL